MPNIYGKTNNVVTKKEYVGVETDTAKVNVNNNNSTISVDVKKTPLPNELEITVLGGEQPEIISYDGAHKREVTVLGQKVLQDIDTEIGTFEEQVNEKLNSYDSEIAKIPAIEESVDSLENRVHNVERVNLSQGIVLGKHDEALDNLNTVVEKNCQDISDNTTAIDKNTQDIAENSRIIASHDTSINNLNTAVNSVVGDLNTEIVNRGKEDAAVIQNAQKIKIEEEKDSSNNPTGRIAFYAYGQDSNPTYVQGGFQPDGETIILSDNELEAIAIKDDDGTITPKKIRQDFQEINQELSAIEGTGGYLLPYDFNIATPDLYTETVFDTDDTDRVLISSLNKMFDDNGEIVPYVSGQGDLITTDAIEYDSETGKATANSILSLLTQYALSQIDNINNAVDIWNGTRVENTYNGHTWILNNTSNTEPRIFEWIDLGVSTVYKATDNTLGVVKGSSAALKVGIDSNGEMLVNDLSTELSKKQNTLVAGSNIALTAGTGTNEGKTVISADNQTLKVSNVTFGSNDVIELHPGSNVGIAADSTNKTITITATDTTYSNLSPSQGGTDVSLVTTGEKYTWNNKANKTIISDYILFAANWSSNQYTLSITGKTASNNAIVSNSNIGATDADVLANANAIADANIYRIIDNGTSLTFVCETTPTVDLKIQVEVYD